MRGLASALVVSLGAGLLGADPAHAGRNDFTLERLIGPPQAGGGVNEGAGTNDAQSAFRSLMSEMGVVLAPQALGPADSLGWSGFHLSVDSTFTQVSNHADYWQKGVRDVSSGFLPTVGVTARKGIWAPAPSFELGAGFASLLESGLYTINLYAKLGVHEGFRGWPVPSIALRAAVARMLASPQVDLTIVSTDLLVSKGFAAAGVLRLDPYLGTSLLVTVARSQVIDTTPQIDAFRQGPMGVDLNANVAFPDPEAILRVRLFAGLRLVYAMATVSAQFSWTFCNDRAIGCGQGSTTQILDRSDGQAQLSITAGLTY